MSKPAAAATSRATLEDIISAVQKYNPEADLDCIRKAYVFCSNVHKGQKRVSGDPFLIHPLQVAMILSEMRMDTVSIAAGFLHDTVEDTLVSVDEIRSVFGEEIATLVDAITKLSKINFSSREKREAENYRKMFLAMAKDIRVIIVKLADRLHNMRTLQYLPEHKQIKVAQETLNIYAPIAGRLGMQEMKIELENLAFATTKPDVWERIERQVEQLKKHSSKFMDKINDIVKRKLVEFGIKADVSCRVKHQYSIYKKMEEQKVEFDQIHDLIAFRVIVDSVKECYECLGIIHSIWKPVHGRFKDFISMPKTNNYQSLHTTVIIEGGHRIEFQIRTRAMHAMAEWGVASHWKYKTGKEVEPKDEIKFRWLRQFMELQKELSDPAEYLDTVRIDLFASEVYVFTPQGQLRELPRGSSPVDFAYAIHTDVGNQCVGARVNGKIVPLRYILRNGDTIEILTSPNHKPSKDWLKFVQTSKARSKIRQYVRIEQRQRSHDLGQDLLEKEFDKYGEKFGHYVKSGAFDQYFHKVGMKDMDQMLALIGYGRLNVTSIVEALIPAEKRKKQLPHHESAISKIFKRAKEKSKGVVRVAGLDDIMVSFGKCCNPIPGDRIMGFITRGRGITVHTLDCPRMLTTDPVRRVEVQWDKMATSMRPARIRVVAVDKTGILSEISQAIASMGINISQANCRSVEDNKAINTFDVLISDISHLFELIKNLEKIRNVISVERVKG
ncbi:MAG: GTP pyrophosphokinase [Deltaproteobacteria bacterium RIFCSPLOWO2_02_FULL_50_16]|nr:MAG: GTP pyrophosphokinase [Deltaproteobacteria bacterium GWA2_50_8]OGQ25732.1 MAG: GTP pyrophosphokinase [Deltaproteobacteria bacterium RIFCSPHIGHO2_02_FULL_50_15]OGQ57024.1 MAG: GTP pyrophosphokinase [Deltaproteobacteria bacterium RIFCSPLOWO2_02_FULL_50_16]OGQ68074.1 MAG: GTP pyrophosphokinase [Deltaproteobacteria bacterium RIFCSPLOWO2_12_FULL_50_11]